jgi:hypothetical protein
MNVESPKSAVEMMMFDFIAGDRMKLLKPSSYLVELMP